MSSHEHATAPSSTEEKLHIIATLTDEQLKPLRDLGFTGEVGVAMPYRGPDGGDVGFRPVIRFGQDDDRFKTNHSGICDMLTEASWLVQTQDGPLQTTSFREAFDLSHDYREADRVLVSEAWVSSSQIPPTQNWLLKQLSGSIQDRYPEATDALRSALERAVMEAVHALPFFEHRGDLFTEMSPDRESRGVHAAEMINAYTAAMSAPDGDYSRAMQDVVWPACGGLVRTVKPPTLLDNVQSLGSELLSLAQGAVEGMRGFAAQAANDIPNAAESVAGGVSTFAADTVEGINSGGWMPSSEGEPKRWVKLPEL